MNFLFKSESIFSKWINSKDKSLNNFIIHFEKVKEEYTNNKISVDDINNILAIINIEKLQDINSIYKLIIQLNEIKTLKKTSIFYNLENILKLINILDECNGSYIEEFNDKKIKTVFLNDNYLIFLDELNSALCHLEELNKINEKVDKDVYDLLKCLISNSNYIDIFVYLLIKDYKIILEKYILPKKTNYSLVFNILDNKFIEDNSNNLYSFYINLFVSLDNRNMSTNIIENIIINDYNNTYPKIIIDLIIYKNIINSLLTLSIKNKSFTPVKFSFLLVNDINDIFTLIDTDNIVYIINNSKDEVSSSDKINYDSNYVLYNILFLESRLDILSDSNTLYDNILNSDKYNINNKLWKNIIYFMINKLIVDKDNYKYIYKLLKLWKNYYLLNNNLVSNDFDIIIDKIVSLTILSILNNPNSDHLYNLAIELINNNQLYTKINKVSNIANTHQLNYYIRFLELAKNENYNINNIVKESIYCCNYDINNLDNFKGFELFNMIKNRLRKILLNYNNQSSNIVEINEDVFNTLLFINNNILSLQDILIEILEEYKDEILIINDNNLLFFNKIISDRKFYDYLYNEIINNINTLINNSQDNYIKLVNFKHSIKELEDIFNNKYENNNTEFYKFIKKYIKARNYIDTLYYLQNNKYAINLFSFDEFINLNKEEIIKVLLTKKYKFHLVNSLDNFLLQIKSFFTYFNYNDESYYISNILFPLFLNINNIELLKQCIEQLYSLYVLNNNEEISNKLYYNLEKCFVRIISSKDNKEKTIQVLKDNRITNSIILVTEKSNNNNLLNILAENSLYDQLNPVKYLQKTLNISKVDFYNNINYCNNDNSKKSKFNFFEYNCKKEINSKDNLLSTEHYNNKNSIATLYNIVTINTSNLNKKNSLYNLNKEALGNNLDNENTTKDIDAKNEKNISSKLYTLNNKLSEALIKINYNSNGKEFKINTDTKFRFNLFKKLVYKNSITLIELIKIEGIKLDSKYFNNIYDKKLNLDLNKESNLNLVIDLSSFVINIYNETILNNREFIAIVNFIKAFFKNHIYNEEKIDENKLNSVINKIIFKLIKNDNSNFFYCHLKALLLLIPYLIIKNNNITYNSYVNFIDILESLSSITNDSYNILPLIFIFIYNNYDSNVFNCLKIDNEIKTLLLNYYYNYINKYKLFNLINSDYCINFKENYINQNFNNIDSNTIKNVHFLLDIILIENYKKSNIINFIPLKKIIKILLFSNLNTKANCSYENKTLHTDLNDINEMLLSIKLIDTIINYSRTIFKCYEYDLIKHLNKMNFIKFNKDLTKLLVDNLFKLHDFTVILEGNLNLFIFDLSISNCIKDHFNNKLSLIQLLSNSFKLLKFDNQKVFEIKDFFNEIKELDNEIDVKDKYIELYDKNIS